MKFSLKVAFKFLTKNRLINLLIFFTILIGISVQFFIISLSSVLKNIIISQAISYQSHISLKYNESLKHSDLDFDFQNEINSLSNISDVHHFVNLFGTLEKPDGRVVPYYFYGIDYSSNDMGSYLKSYGIGLDETLVKGEIADPYKNEIMVDDSFFNEQNLKLDDEVIFFHPFSNVSVTYIIKGTYHTGKYDYLNNTTYVNNLQFEFKDRASYSIKVILKDPYLVKETINEIKALSGYKDIYEITTYEETNEKALEMDFIQRAVVGLIEILISVVILIIIVNILNYSMQRKYKEIGILKAMGINDKGLRLVFLFQTLMIQVLASIFGLLVGRTSFAFYHKIMKNPYTNKPRFEYNISISNYVYTFIAMVLVSVFASIFSYRKVKQLEIIDLIKL